MKNKNVGLLIIGISLVIGFIVLMFNLGMTSIVNQTCSHGPSCSMYGTIKTQTYVSLGVAFMILFIGLFLFYSKPEEKIVVKKVIEKQKKKKIDLAGLEKDEKDLIEVLLNDGKACFQSSLMEKLDIGKVKTTRLLDKLEAKQLIERKRRGMNNIIVLKD